MSRLVAAVLFLLLLISRTSLAESYYWKPLEAGGSVKYPDIFSACQDSTARWNAAHPDMPAGTYTKFVMLSAEQANCRGRSSNSPDFSLGLVVRGGNGCDEGTEYDAQTGACKAPPRDCAETKGEPFPAKGPDSPVISSGGRNYIADSGAPTACYEQCQYTSETGRSTSCYFVKGSTTQGFCNYILNGTGENCPADAYQFSETGDQLNPPTDPADPSVPPSDPNDPGCPEGWAWSGTTCVKADPSNPGDGSGDGSGEGDGDGNSGGGNPGGGDGSGSGDGDGSGTGDGDGTGNGDGSGSGNGDGDGEGEGQCDPAKDPNGCQGQGPSGTLSEPEAGSWDEANQEWDQKIQDAKKELKDAVKGSIDQLKGAFDLQLSTGGGQLPCEAINVWGKSYRLCVADYSSQLSYLRLALLLMAALIAAFIILKE